ncbi:hypothetical protein [Clostridium felsineum]|uniref:hypothetical protein n=1 Tax=Clostridium felsineum TaxID=36839 RepID=UPI00098C0770|nr:hypothetical protein [Clostridium felsineum]URZ16873.1 hypothetical protein CLFE_029200 [Clostridium felsineum DSM 794]
MPKLTFPYIDYESQYLIAMTPEHHIRQLGGSFVFSYAYGSALAVNGSVYLQFILPNFTLGNKEVALKPVQVASDQLVKVEFFEAPTVTNGTTSVPIVNQNRFSTQTAQTAIYSNPTNISGGTLLRTRFEGTGTNAKPVGLSGDYNDLGWQLKSATIYVLKLTNVGSQATNVLCVNGQIFEIERG